jgi:hypothetical protein
VSDSNVNQPVRALMSGATVGNVAQTRQATPRESTKLRIAIGYIVRKDAL